MVVGRFNGDVFCFCPGYLATEVVEVIVLLKVEMWDKAIHEVVVEKVTIQIVNIAENGVTLMVDTSTVASTKTDSRKG